MPFYVAAIKAQIKYPAICFPRDTFRIERDRWVKSKGLERETNRQQESKGSPSGLLSFRM